MASGQPLAVVFMGPAGAGKSTVGRAMAAELGWRFVDADDHHDAASIAKIRSGVPLDDADRGPWLERLHRLVADATHRGEPLVLACSALRQEYRARIARGLERVRFVYLRGAAGVLEKRLGERPGHFAGPELLPSQLAALEEPEDATVVDATRPPAEIVASVRAALGI